MNAYSHHLSFHTHSWACHFMLLIRLMNWTTLVVVYTWYKSIQVCISLVWVLYAYGCVIFSVLFFCKWLHAGLDLSSMTDWLIPDLETDCLSVLPTNRSEHGWWAGQCGLWSSNTMDMLWQLSETTGHETLFIQQDNMNEWMTEKGFCGLRRPEKS